MVLASARMASGVIKLGGSQDVILVLDTSKRMAGYFQRLKSAALQYVYGKCTKVFFFVSAGKLLSFYVHVYDRSFIKYILYYLAYSRRVFYT